MTDQTTGPREKLLAAGLESGGAVMASTASVAQDQDGEATLCSMRADVNDLSAGAAVCVARESSGADPPRAPGWLGLAAAPTFALMAMWNGVSGGGPIDMLCSTAHGASPLSGMAVMYALMGVFHSGPWWRLIARRRSAGRRA